MKKLFLLLLAVMVFVGSGCGVGSDGGSGGASRSLVGYWEGVLPDGDFDGQQDEFPYHYIFLDITSQSGGTIAGHFYRQVGTERSDAPLLGTIDAYRQFQFSTELDEETVTFTGHLESLIHDYVGEHFVADWTASGGQSGTVVFVAINTHIQPGESAAAARKADPDIVKAAISEDTSLNKYGGNGQPVIFVHGWNSSPDTWNSMIAKFESDGYLNHYEVWRFGYSSHYAIEDIGAELYNKAGAEGLLDKNPFIIAHSMGGVVARAYIKHNGTFSMLITLSSPHVGTPLAVFGGAITRSAQDIAPCSPTLIGIFNYETSHDPFSQYAVVSGKLTGGWRWVTLHKCWTVCPFGHCYTKCTDTPAYLWQYDRDYETQYKAETIVISGLGFGDNDGVVPTSSENFCAHWSPLGLGCDICPSIDYEHDKHLTNYDHSMVLEPSTSPDVYDFVMSHL